MTRPEIRRSPLPILALGLACLAPVGVAAAQMSAAPSGGVAEEFRRPPKIEPPARSKAWLYFLVGGALSAAAVGAAAMPSQRTHQD